MEQMGFKKGVLVVLITNIISMLFNLAINFLQPKFLSIETYSVLKTFTLYLSAAGLFHLGFIDGMYIKYGGKNIEEIDKLDLVSNIGTMRIFQIIISFVVCMVGFLVDDSVILLFGTMLVPYNMTMYYKMLFQSLGQFHYYGRIMNVSIIFIFLFNIYLIFILHSDDYTLYILIQLLSYLVIWIFVEQMMKRRLSLNLKWLSFSKSTLMESVQNGFFVMVGNFSSIFLVCMDRWQVKYLMDYEDFAGYSFAASVEGFLNVAVTPFTITLYNYFCKEHNEEKHRLVHNVMLIVATLLVSSVFLIKYIVEKYIPAYLFSVDVMIYLFAGQLFFVITKSIYVNLYKAHKRQTAYFSKLIVVLGFGFFVNLLFYALLKSKEAMAIGTLCTAVLWFYISINDFKYISYDWKHVLYLFFMLSQFLFAGLNFPAMLGLVIYLSGAFVLAIALLKTDLMFIQNTLFAGLRIKR